MKEKKNILMVVFGVAFVALIIAVIAGLFDAFFVLTDGDHVINYDFILKYAKYKTSVGVFELIASILGIAFCVVYILELLKKSNKNLTRVQFVLAIVNLFFFIVAFILLRVTLPNTKSNLKDKSFSYIPEGYTLFVACFNILTNIFIPEMIVFVSYMFIKHIKKMELKQERIDQMQKALEQQEEKMFK